MNKPDILEIKEKERRVREFLNISGYEAVIIGRQDNFSWYTCGGNNRVVITSELGFSILIITLDKTYLVSQVMDGPRTMDEELQGVDIEPVFLRWYEESREEMAEKLIKGLKAISDIPLHGAEYSPSEIYNLHDPLTEKEIEKCRWIGSKTEEIIRKVADEIKPGMTEHEVEAMLHFEYAKYNITPEVMLIGSDERISKYRHPCPSDKKIERLVMLHPGVKKWGIHANVSRMVYFGDEIPEDIKKRYKAACEIEAAAISMCVPGTKFSQILEVEKKVYKENGFEDEWRNHFQGGITGYLLADAALCKNPNAIVKINQTYDWFITITGVKVEELSINTAKGVEVLSSTGRWPTETFEYNGKRLKLPQILTR